MLHLHEMHPYPKVEAKVEVEDHQELEIKHLNKGTKIGKSTKFLHSSNASIVGMQPRRRWLILKRTWCLHCSDGEQHHKGIIEGHSCQETRKCVRTNRMD
jgi:hypothetical protein